MDDPVGRVIASTNRSPAKTQWYRRPQMVEQRAEVSGGPGSQMSNISQHQSVTQLSTVRVYFDLRIFQERSDSDPLAPTWEPVNAPLQLGAGHRYRIRVTPSPNQTMSQRVVQYPVTVIQTMDMYLQSSQSISAFSLSEVRGTIKPEEIEQFEHDFLLTIQPECPVAILFLELIYEENSNIKIATRLPIELKGNYNEVDAKLWERVGIDDSIRPPSSMALLHIEAVEQGRLRLSCWNRRPLPNRPDFLEPIDQPELGLDSLMGDTNDSQAIQDVIDHIRDFFTMGIPELSAWFSEMIQQHRGQCCIVIVDETAANVPWEMLEVDEGKFLGAQVDVVRWTQAQYLKLRAILQLHDKEQHTGTLLAYVNAKDRAHAHHECPVLAHLTPRIYESEEEMRPYLTPQELPKIGLIYLRYRGSFIYGNEPQQIRQAISNPYGKPVKIRFEQVQALVGKRPMVFVNACHSARLYGNNSYGLVRILLARFASGYIGTIGSVEPSYAARVAHSILHNVSSTDDEVVLTELLRRLRQLVADRYTSNSALLENKLEFVYTFMYVYYGNPYARLRLMDASNGDTQ